MLLLKPDKEPPFSVVTIVSSYRLIVTMFHAMIWSPLEVSWQVEDATHLVVDEDRSLFSFERKIYNNKINK
jgi:hypothetical protein